MRKGKLSLIFRDVVYITVYMLLQKRPVRFQCKLLAHELQKVPIDRTESFLYQPTSLSTELEGRSNPSSA